MYAVISLLVVLIVSILVVRVATIALTLTGISHHLARFQARSAFTGAGFTTSESEKVVSHPVRRRIIMLLMLTGNAGIVTAISTLMLSFIGTSNAERMTGQLWFRVLLLAVGLGALFLLAHSKWIDQRMSQIVAWALKRWTNLEVRDYAGLLHLTGDYIVAEMQVGSKDWISGRPLRDLKLRDEGIVVLGIERTEGAYLGVPRGDAVINGGDTLVLYGRKQIIEGLDSRREGPSGNWQHVQAVEEQIHVKEEEKVADPAEENAEASSADISK